MNHKTEGKNQVYVRFDARSMNEGFARMVVMGFMMDMNPTMDELTDVKTAVSEAVTNAIIHGYAGCIKLDETSIDEKNEIPQVEMICIREGKMLTIRVEDHGVGIEDIEEARQPFFTTKPELERSGMGFSFMESFMDEVEVISTPGKGTSILMRKYIASKEKDGV